MIYFITIYAFIHSQFSHGPNKQFMCSTAVATTAAAAATERDRIRTKMAKMCLYARLFTMIFMRVKGIF